MAHLPPPVPFKRIPHFDISELLDPDNITIVNGLRPHEGRHQRRLCSTGSAGRAAKFRRTTGGSIPNTAAQASQPEVQPPVVIKSKLKTELPTCDIDLFEFRDKYRRMMDRLDALRENVINIKVKQLQTELGIESLEDAKALYKLRTDAKLIACLSQPIRTPTISEVISSASRINLRRVMAARYGLGAYLGKRLEIPFNETTNPWSEKNLFRLFAQAVNLESYKLATGERRYMFQGRKRDAALTRSLMLKGPQNSSTPPTFHKHATERYLEQNRHPGFTLVADDELIITMSLYHGVRGHKLREFDMLSSQTLAELRDAFKCPSEIRPMNVEINANGSCFMLNGQLFPDLRYGACDYSEPLLYFLHRYKPSMLRTSECIEQKDAVLSHLELPLYMPGFLLHHGDCEHRLMITAIRAYDKTRDCPYEECYPVKVFVPRHRAMLCHVCEFSDATTTVFNSLVLPHIPSYLCDDCYTRFKRLGKPGGVYRSDGLAQTVAIEFCEE
ncbi:snRNA-activating complex protein, putative [Babesia ovis]|uniref:snRNA-activating complex protein, putative n=1 Tax=Babesia ovis TaxID=5869 RepID=A0A9W5TCF4_BABOV|nr:snRNA-activating complex protein, putative [Babesia ovis]